MLFRSHRLVKICKVVSSKYTRSKVRKALPKEFSYIIEELLHENSASVDKDMYYTEIIHTIIDLGQADRFIVAMCNLIQRLAIDQLHVIGDIYDRGPHAARIMDILSHYHSVDIQWGNHDIAWMGAAAGCQALICNVLRIQTRYANLDTIEEDYGINLLPLATFAMDKYAGDPCEQFKPKGDEVLSDKDFNMIAKMHKAISIMQWKMEGQIIKRRPEFRMENRLLLDKIDFEKGTVLVDGVEYPMNDMNFPTIDPKDPYKLTEEEQEVMDKVKSSFVNSEKLQQHVRVLYHKGSMYTIFNSNLLFHGGIPMNADGTLKEVTFRGKKYIGMEYLDAVERTMREGYFNKAHTEAKRECMDYIWYMWCGEDSPLFGKKKMTTFERYFIDDKKTHKEEKNPYYADLLSEDYAGIKGELTAITQYSYQHMEKFSSNIEFSKIMEEIAKAEMIHLELLGKTIKLLGKNPIYSTCEASRGDCIMWNSNFVNYSTDLKDMLKIDISSEEAAIKTYTLHKKLIDDKYIKEMLDRIIMDEKRHLEIFNYLYDGLESVSFWEATMC